MFDEMDFDSGFEWDNQERLATEAYQFYEQGQMLLALEQINKALEINPASTSLNFNKALILDVVEKYEAAIECYKKALESKPNDPEIYNSLAVDYTRIGLYDLAIETFDQALSCDCNFEPAYCNSIITYTEMGKYDKAEESFYMAQQINPDCPICFYNIGNSMFCRGKMERALWCWEKTRYLDDDHPQINYRIAQAHWSMGNSNFANDSFLAELRTNPGNTDVLLDYALFLLQDNKIDSAREKLHRIIELEPQSPQAYQFLGELELNMGNIDTAEKHFRKALVIDDIAGPHFRLGEIEFNRQRYENAKMHFKHELSFDIEDFDVLMAIGTMLLEINEYDVPTQCFLKAADVNPTSYLPFYYMGMCMFNAGEPNDARHFFSYSRDLNSDHIQSYIMMAKCHLADHHYQMAIESLEEILQSQPDNKELKKMLRFIKIQFFGSKFRQLFCDFTLKLRTITKK